ALYAAFGTVPVVQAAFTGVKAAVIVIVLQALIKLMGRALTGPLAYGLAGASFVSIFVFNLPFPIIICIAAVIGATQAVPVQSAPLAPVKSHPIRTLAIWLPLWLGPLALLSLSGADLLADLGWFFAWLAVVTFGGAYAVLAYMTQIAVDTHGWISTPQMIDALGLAETTPGPLILVTQFVAMLAGQLQGGYGLALAAGLVALWATFVPCFLWIFLTGPYLDHIAARPRLGAAMRGISAAGVGVILHLSVWFALHVLFMELRPAGDGPIRAPVPVLSSLDPIALGLTAIALILMVWLKLGIARSLVILAACGAATLVI
ncbi:MAG: chromate transporter, partial [Paracoccaceae bacterium]